MNIETNITAMLEDAKQLDIVELAVKYGVSIETMTLFLEEQKVTTLPSQVDEEVLAPVIVVDKTYKFGTPAGTRGEKDKKTINLHTDGDFDIFYKQFREWLGWYKEPAPKQPRIRNTPQPELTVVAGDLHVPYHNEDALKWMINRTCKQASRIIIGGDIADMFWCSKYMKFDQHFTPLEEMKRVQAVLVALSEAYDEVILMRGNHDDRFIKYLLRQGMKPEAMEVFKYLYGEFAMHPIFVMAHGLSNVKVVEPLTKDYAEFSYLYQHGDLVVSHAEKFSQQPNKVAEDVAKTLMSYHVPAGLIKPFNILVQCHTHMAGKTFGDFSKVTIENGCLAMTPDYSGGARYLPRRIPSVGYTEIWQTNGISDLEKSNFIPYQG